MNDWIPLFQTLVWPLVVVGVVLWLRRPLVAIADAIEERVKGGERFEAGPSGLKLGVFLPRSLEKDRVFEDVISPSLEAIAGRVEAVLANVEDRTAKTVSDAVRAASSEAAESIRQTAFLKIDSRPLLGKKGGEWLVEYSQYRAISPLFDDIWFTIGSLPNQSYCAHWVLKDKENGRVFTDVGRSWALTQGGYYDQRPLEEVGIHPGMSLAVVRPDS